MTRVMIAVDGSDLDRVVADGAYRLFGDDAEYLAINVQQFGNAVTGSMPIPVPAMYAGGLAGYGTVYPYVPADLDSADVDEEVRAERARAERTAREVADEAGMADADVVGEIGDPPDAILAAADEHDVDVIVVGNHERGWWSKLLVASVTQELLASAQLPVLVIKAPDVTDAATGAK